jgi:SNF2 family DNA or RNA helicase
LVSSHSFFTRLTAKASLDDDEVVVVGSTNDDKEVCYGRIDNARVQAHQVPYPNPKAVYLSKTDWPSMKLHLQRFVGRNVIIRVFDQMGKDFGNIDVRTSLGLAPLMDSTNLKIRVQARLDSRKAKEHERPGYLCSDSYNATINLYGPKRNAVQIGKFLSQKQVYLRQPYSVDKDIDVCNPHVLNNAAYPRITQLSPLAGSGYVTRTVEEVRNDVISMFDTLEKSETLPEMEPSDTIITPLLSHQKQALYFMTNKEQTRVFSSGEEKQGSLWRLRHRPNGQKVYYNVITGREEVQQPHETLGGILADMMGLGKTLSILALIAESVVDGLEWAKQIPPNTVGHDGNVLKRNSKTTLLVAPLSVIANWEEQIATHIRPGTVSLYIYHGNNRSRNVDVLAEYDIVITTYSTIASEFIGRSKKRDGSPLFQTNFFRIVLDEAHMIREQATRQSQAICALSAQRRWAVTGTPVQNRLDDLGALLKFLRLKPFDEKGGFAQYIASPFKNADPEIIPKLRLLVDSITLRRLKDSIDLPPRHERVVRLLFNTEERELYEWFAKDAVSRTQAITNGRVKGLGGKSYVQILKAILRLRLICAHGKELLSDEDLKITEGFSSTTAIDLEEEPDDKPAINKRQAYEMLKLFEETDSDKCTQCMRQIGKDPNAEEKEDDTIGVILPCFQLVCNDCFKDLETFVRVNKTPDNHFVCPFCTQYVRTSFFRLTQSGLEEAEKEKEKTKENPRHSKMIGRYGGPHTKTVALIQGLREAMMESLEHPDEPPVKSVVFSQWTTHLDLIQLALEDNKLNYVRLDGRMSRPQRANALEKFRSDQSIAVILVSINAGGLGLNLTTASRVYVMEPQFNPAAEAQAVDRVHRLGQKREVFITRFIMDNSFEEKMLQLQNKKRNLADLSMNKQKLDKAEIARRKLEDLRSLFK